MNELPASDSHCQPNRPLRRRMLAGLRWALAIVAAVVCGVLWLGWRPKLPSGPVHLVRGGEGRLGPEANDADSSGIHLELLAAKINANNQLTSTSNESGPSQARFACRRMVIFNHSQHVLMQRAGLSMLQHLKDVRGFEQIDYYPAGKSAEPGELAPDVAVTLTLDDVKTSGLPGSRTLDAQIGLCAGSTLMNYGSHYSDGLDPPQVRWSMSATLTHHSTTTGVGTPSARFKLAAEDIGKQLGAALARRLNKWHDKHGPLPSLPDAFYPPYVPPPELPLPAQEPAELVASYHGLMKSNESLWRIESARELADVLNDLEARLKARGWKTERLQTAADSLPVLRMLHGEDMLTAYPEHKRDDATPATIAGRTPPQVRPGPPATIVMVHLVDRMSRAQAAAAVAALLDGKWPAEKLLIFESMLTGPDRERLMERIAARCPPSPEAWIALVQWHEGAKRSEAAREALQRAHVLLRTLPDQGDLPGRIQELAKKLDHKLPRDGQPGPELLASLGFVEITPAGVSDRELALDEPALYWARRDGKPITIALRVVKQGGAGGPAAYAINYVEARDGSSSCGTGDLDYRSALDGMSSVTFHAEPVEIQPRFRLSARVGREAR